VFWMIFVMALLSFLLSEWGWRNKPNANFYLAPTRAWELLAGSMASFVVHKRGVKKSDLLSLLGLAAIVFSIFTYDETTPFPSFYTLVPVLGVVLLILYADKDTFAAKILSTRAFVGLGLISYSAYLWHQPLFAFARITTTSDPSELVMIALSIISILLAYATWKYVEAPFRSKSTFSLNSIFSFSVVGLSLLICIAYLLPNIGMQRFDSSQVAIISAGESNKQLMKNSAYDRYGCFFDYSQNAKQLIERKCVRDSDKNRLILFGDSEAAHFFEGMKLVFTGYDVMQFTGTSCRAIDYKGNSSRCREFYHLFITNILPSLTSSDTVIVSSNWQDTFDKLGKDEFQSSLKDVLTEIDQTKAKTYVFTNTPGFNQNPYEVLAITLRDNWAENVFLESQLIWQSDLIVEKVADDVGVESFNVSSLICNADQNCLFKDSNDYLYFDTGHLSFYGSGYVANQFNKYFFNDMNE